MENVVIKIGDVKHKLIETPNVIAPCDLCSLCEYCQRNSVFYADGLCYTFGGNKDCYFTEDGE